MTHSKR